MRELTAHKVEGVKDGLTVQDHACEGRYYSISFAKKDGRGEMIAIPFQNGPLPEVGNNGVTIEALLAICIDRLETFQKGQFACAENNEAIHALWKAMFSLQNRTKDRVKREVKDKMQV